MNIDNAIENGVTIITARGRMNAAETRALEETVRMALDRGDSKILFDFSHLEYINSSGLRVLVMTYQRLKKNRPGEVAIAGLRDYIMELFEISGYDKLFSLYETPQDALEALHKAQP